LRIAEFIANIWPTAVQAVKRAVRDEHEMTPVSSSVSNHYNAMAKRRILAARRLTDC